MLIGIVGKPNVGKSTFFSACSLAKAEIASYPFTTIKPNRGVAWVRAKCPHADFNVQCNPKNSKCKNNIRYIPVEIIDVAGLVPGAHKGRGLGNKFLDDLRQADALIHIVDAAGATDFEGNICAVGTHNPLDDVLFLEEEIAHWLKGIIAKDWKKFAREAESAQEKPESVLSKRLTGLGITEHDIKRALQSTPTSEKLKDWNDNDLINFAKHLQKVSKPIIICANKCDIAPDSNLDKLKKLDRLVIPASAESELALRRAAESKLIDYEPGSSEIKISAPEKLTDRQRKGLEFIKKVLEKFGTSGVQECIEQAVFKMLDYIVVYPVEDENKLTDKDGNVLPDAYLMKRGSTARELAYKVHTELGDKFIRAINARVKRVVGADYELHDGDVIKIIAAI
ncbi:MAG: redox-regulated ATPase YchF [Candidatus Thermoplasmatota archaeon]|nr:redox-regulated ATPase YchF [Candidatus Thermoplasmatota archaeon]